MLSKHIQRYPYLSMDIQHIRLVQVPKWCKIRCEVDPAFSILDIFFNIQANTREYVEDDGTRHSWRRTKNSPQIQLIKHRLHKVKFLDTSIDNFLLRLIKECWVLAPKAGLQINDQTGTQGLTHQWLNRSPGNYLVTSPQDAMSAICWHCILRICPDRLPWQLP